MTDSAEPIVPLDTNFSHDLVIIGGNAGGLSLAISAQRSGVKRIRIVESGSAVVFPELVGEEQLDVGYGETVSSIDADANANGDAAVVVTTNKHVYRTRTCVIAERAETTDVALPDGTPKSDRVLIDALPEDPFDEDILVVGFTDHAVELASTLVTAQARVVLAGGGMDTTLLSPAGDNWLRRLERQRKITLLYRSVPEQIELVDGFPMAYFGDRRTPDLQFDRVVYASARSTLSPESVGVTNKALETGRVWFIGEPSDDAGAPPTAPGWQIGIEIAKLLPGVEAPLPPSEARRRRRYTSMIDDLRAENYNAEITYFEPTHSDLWVLRVKPDHGEVAHLPGQYASLGLGYWEERIDDAEDPNIEERWDKLVRRSYSISSRMFDDHGYLAGEEGAEELEFYIVLVPPTEDNVPGLTPRLALKRPGDRIYLGPKVAGRYTLAPVTNPSDTVLFLSTGTGEAPHNAMVIELLRKGHTGPIVSAVSVRKWADLGYIDQHRTLEERYSNYHYLPLPTREEDVPKRYIQDLIRENVFEEQFGVTLNAETTHVFLCGNPSMIGLPEEDDEGAVVYPEVTGVVELLSQQGFVLDHRKQRGNIHFEEYW